MELRLKRTTFTSESTIGELYIDGEFECNTLEDVVRDGPKVFGKTAIPYGKYKVVITMSNRFKRLLPLLLNVDNFEGVRIHPGNYAKDTEGCILVGINPRTDYIGKSQDTFGYLFPKLQEAIKNGESINLTIEN